MSSTEAPEILTVEEAADYLKVSTKQIYRLVESNSIVYFRIGNRIRIPKATIVPSLVDSVLLAGDNFSENFKLFSVTPVH